MHSGIGSLVVRKLITTFFVTTIFSILLLLFSIDYSKMIYDRGIEFIGWFYFSFIYSGLIILIYGNLISIGVEYIQRKGFIRQDWLHVIILGIFGLLFGLLLQELIFAIYGLLTALLYAIVDKYLYVRLKEAKQVKVLILVPIVSLLLAYGFLQVTSPSMPPFSKEEAVQFATSGEGTPIDYFPKEIGIWEGTVDGYQVKRETNVKEIGEELYLVTFTETWGKGARDFSWSLSFKVERGTLSAYEEKGRKPPYYK